MNNGEHRHIDQAELDKQERFREQRHAAMADRYLTIVFTLLAVAVIAFLVWSHVADTA